MVFIRSSNIHQKKTPGYIPAAGFGNSAVTGQEFFGAGHTFLIV
jgi:hypothetical protein